MSRNPPLGGLGAKQPDGGGKCSCCGGKCTEPTECTKRKGCGKCKKPQLHPALNCPDHPDFPNFDAQVCDQCFDDRHEFSECPDRIDNFCQLCGHDHLKPKCPFKSSAKADNLSEKQLDQFTRKYRLKYLDDPTKKKPASSKPATSSPTSSSHRAGASQSPSKSPRNSQTASPSMVREPSAPTTLEEKEDPMAVRRKMWDEAEKLLPKRQVGQSPSAGGEKIKANFFEVKISAKALLYRYAIILGEIQKKDDAQSTDTAIVQDENDAITVRTKKNDKRKLRRETKRHLIRRLLEDNVPHNQHYATDYDSVIISAGPLYNNSANGSDQVTETPHLLSSDPNQPKNRLIQSQVKFLGKVNIEGLIAHVKYGTYLQDIVNELKALNVVFWKEINCPSFSGGRVGNKFYPLDLINQSDEEAKRRNSLYLIRNGFFSSMRPGIDSLLLNVNVVTSAFYSPINLQTWIEMCWGDKTPIPSKEFKSKLKDIRVTLDLHQESRIFVICNIGREKVCKTTFENKEKKEVKVSKYLEDTYDDHPWEKKDWDAFCINVGSEGRKIWYPATKLTIIDWQVVREKFDDAYSKEMLEKATKNPQQNKDYLEKAYSWLGLKPKNSHCSGFGITATPKMVDLVAPKLKAPRLIFATKDSVPIINGSWNLKNHPQFVQRGVDCKSLFVINFSDERVLPYIEHLLGKLVHYKLCNAKVAIKLVEDSLRMPPSSDGPKENYREICRAAFEAALSEFGSSKSSIQFLLVILPKRDIRMYQELKNWADREAGILTVCVTLGKLKKIETDETLCANVCLKINFKLKGVSHKIEHSEFHGQGISGAKINTLIVGADVTHPGQGIDNCPSMAAVVATDDDVSSRYLGSARLQKGKQEFISDLTGMMRERVMAWHKAAIADPAKKKLNWNKKLPDHILFYRDGVSESQYGMVLHEEKPQILDGCAKAFTELKKSKGNGIGPKDKWNPKLTLLVVTKRHHARFFPFKDCVAGMENVDINLESGTVVDTKVVTPNHQSFYLQSHHSKLGTARSAHYVVIYNGNDYSLDKLQKITNNICYTSARATKAVSVCTPARYADLLCDRLRCYMYPALKGFYYPPPPDTPEKQSPKVSPRSSISDTPEDPDNPRYIKKFEDDRHVWKGPVQPNDKQKNPWHPNLDKCMFYL